MCSRNFGPSSSVSFNPDSYTMTERRGRSEVAHLGGLRDRGYRGLCVQRTSPSSYNMTRVKFFWKGRFIDMSTFSQPRRRTGCVPEGGYLDRGLWQMFPLLGLTLRSIGMCSERSTGPNTTSRRGVNKFQCTRVTTRKTEAGHRCEVRRLRK
jgi:hypothetical protein